MELIGFRSFEKCLRVCFGTIAISRVADNSGCYYCWEAFFVNFFAVLWLGLLWAFGIIILCLKLFGWTLLRWLCSGGALSNLTGRFKFGWYLDKSLVMLLIWGPAPPLVFGARKRTLYVLSSDFPRTV